MKVMRYMAIMVMAAAVLWFISIHVLMWAWNASLVPLFHAPVLTVWPAFALTVLIIFVPRPAFPRWNKKDGMW